MIRILERSKGNVLGLEVSEEITEADIKKVIPPLNAAIEKYGKINWLFVAKTTKYENFRTLYEDMKWLLKNVKNFKRMAIVSDKTWLKILVKTDGLAFGEKYFDISELDAAWDYVEGV